MNKVKWGVLGTASIARGCTIPGMKMAENAEFTEDGVDQFTTAYLKFGNIRTSMNCGMVFNKENPRRMDRLYIHGDCGENKSYTGFNEDGELHYTINVDGKIEEKTVFSLQNYRLEIEQFGRCILDGEKPHISELFSVKNARIIDSILAAINY